MRVPAVVLQSFACGLALGAARLPAASPELPPDAPLVRAIDQLVAERGVTGDAPGVGICIVQPGHWSFTKGYGQAVLDDGVPIDLRTRFELASLSKPFTALAVLILHDRGKLGLTDDVRRHLPELPEYEPSHPIRVVDLLQHISGMPDYLAFKDVSGRHQDFRENADYVGEFAKRQAEFPLGFPTGRKYEYSNTNYMLLATIVERAAGKRFGEFLRDEVFLPAGMKRTFVYENRDAVRGVEETERDAIGYVRDGEQSWQAAWGLPPRRRESLLTVGDGAIWSCLEDMARWDAALRSGRLLKPETARLALEPSHTSDGATNNYGLGWAIYPNADGGLTGYGHDGSWGGFRTSYYRYLAADRSTIILSNRGDFDVDSFWYALDRAIESHLPRQ